MVAAFVLPTMAQSAQEWQTASLPGSGSNYAPQVTAVGSSVAASEATTTTETYSPAGNPGAIRRGFDLGGDTKPSDQSPVGDAVLPLLLLAAAFAGVIYFRRRKRARVE